MDTNKRQRSDHKEFIFEFGIVIGIVICIIVLINYGNIARGEIEEREKDISMYRDAISDSIIEDQLAKGILLYRPYACKLIEVYDEDLNSMFTIHFYDSEPSPNGMIKDHDSLTNVLKSSEEGHTTINFEDKEEDVYFKWSTNTERNEKYLVLIYTSKESAKYTWVFYIACYAILVMAFILLTKILFERNKARMEHLRSLNIIE